jgi:hypothetical protein
VTRLLKEDLRQKFERQYALPESQEIYTLRKQKVELPFGHIKHNLGVMGFLLRGLAGVKAEFSIMASCFNITRMIGLLGTNNLVEALRAIATASIITGPSAEILSGDMIITEKTVHFRQIIEIHKKSAQIQTANAA